MVPPQWLLETLRRFWQLRSHWPKNQRQLRQISITQTKRILYHIYFSSHWQSNDIKGKPYFARSSVKYRILQTKCILSNKKKKYHIFDNFPKSNIVSLFL